MIMLYGCGRQSANWHVVEKQPPQYIRIYSMEGGNVEYRDSFEQFQLQKGWLYVFPAQQCYELVQSPDDPIDCMYVHADVFPYVLHNPIKIDPRRHAEIQMTLALLRKQFDGHVCDKNCVMAFSNALLQLLVRDGFLHQKIDQRLLGNEKISTEISVEALSRQVGYSNEHFIRSFSKAFGVTPYQYILSQRMNEAIALMHQGLTLDEIAAKVGYASAKSFSGAFKRHFGYSPQMYRAYFLGKA